MANQRDTVVYELEKGNEVVYIGTTNNPERREQQHRQEGKQFDFIKIISLPMTEEGAKRIEAERLATYRSNQGRNPKYNKDHDG